GVGIGTANPSRELEVQNANDTEIGIKSTDTNGHLWTLQSSAVTGSANLDASFQIIDRTANQSRFFIGTNGNVGIGTRNPQSTLQVGGLMTATLFQGNGASVTNVDAITIGGIAGSNLWTLNGNNVAAG